MDFLLIWLMHARQRLTIVNAILPMAHVIRTTQNSARKQRFCVAASGTLTSGNGRFDRPQASPSLQFQTATNDYHCLKGNTRKDHQRNFRWRQSSNFEKAFLAYGMQLQLQFIP